MRVRRAELVAVLSLGADLGLGQPMEHVLRECLIAMRLAERTGLDERVRATVYYTALLTWVGCHVDAYEQAKWFGDDLALKSDFPRVDGTRMGFVLRHLGAGRPLLDRARLGVALLGDGRHEVNDILDNHRRAAEDLAHQLGLDRDVPLMADDLADSGRTLATGRAFIAALAGRDFGALRALLDDDVRMRLLAPRGPQANGGGDQVWSRFVGWFAEADELRVVTTTVDAIAGRLVLTYRLRLRTVGGWRLIEQHLFADVGPDARVVAIDLLCSGFRPDGASGPGAGHREASTEPRPAQTLTA